MNLLLIPLGLIVRTDVNQSLQAFAGFFNALELGIPTPFSQDVLTSLNPLFNDFNLGKLETEAFSEVLLAEIIKLVPAAKSDKIPKLKKEWPVVWKDLWNRQCSVEGTSIAVMLHIITRQEPNVIIYSETNPVNFKYICDMLAIHDVGFESLTDRLLLSFEQNKNAGQMLADYLKLNPLKAFRLVGNLGEITSPVFYHLAKAKENAIARALAAFEVTKLDTPAHLNTTHLESALHAVKDESTAVPPSIGQKRRLGN